MAVLEEGRTGLEVLQLPWSPRFGAKGALLTDCSVDVSLNEDDLTYQ